MRSEIARTGSTALRCSPCRRWACGLAVSALVAVATPARSQSSDFKSAPDAFDLSRIPPRPTLPGANPDTNSALAYLRFGISVLDTTHTPEGPAADALYWAARLDPNQPLAYYGRWAAIASSIENTVPGRRRIRFVVLSAANEARLDSLRIRAYLLDPLLDDRLEYGNLAKVAGWVERGKIFQHDHGNEALIAYTKGDFARAVSEWAKAITDHPKTIRYHIGRAHAFYFLHQSDSAIAELQQAEQVYVRRDSTTTMPVYGSREMLSYTIGCIEQRRNNLNAARVAFEHALEDNVGLYTGHEHLGEIAFSQHDMPSALSEFETAISIQPGDPVLHLNYGYVLWAAGRKDDALSQYQTAVQLDPYYVIPYWIWAQALDAQRDTAGALREYHAFLDHAPTDALHWSDAVARISALTR